jgi:histidinol-phosphate/aromatic aminotransferase/cobyric acid decarboxylase-like protein
VDGPPMRLRPAVDDDRDWIYDLRHRVYAEELHQHPPNPAQRLQDNLDGDNVYLVAAYGETRVGFVSITPPWIGKYAIDKYLPRGTHPLLGDDAPFEVRILTVEPRWRGGVAAPLLMYAALRWISARGGRRVVALGRSELLRMYLDAGLRRVGPTVRSGQVTFELVGGAVEDLTRHTLRRYGRALRRLGEGVDWGLDTAMWPGPDGCEHGGSSFDAIGRGFRTLGRRREVIAADVLDAWFPPAPGVIDALADDPGWAARTSPPAGAEGLLDDIATARGVPADLLAVGAGSSDLIFRAFRAWLTPTSRVLLIDPTYGEYAHVTERVIGCRVDRLGLRRDEGWRIDPDRLATALRGDYDLAVLVNPNNPTGRQLPAAQLREVLAGAPARTRVWIDEAYVGYVGFDQSMVDYAAAGANVVVCSSMSKMYALSGLRVAYLVAAAPVAADLRRWTPPWAISLPAQLAAVRALADPGYYLDRWAHTRQLRAQLAADLRAVDETVAIDEAVANFVLMTLPRGGPSAAQVVRECWRHDVHVRDLSPMSPAFEGRTIRVAVKDRTDSARIVTAYAAALDTLRVHSVDGGNHRPLAPSRTGP